ncbi:hypothetical protein [Methylobacterium sp. PvR107]|uniref:hypothetical protein n=1 Tax=Methylobacterium sp. PvR107 TaxID=2806597 RepID=UPI001AE2CCD3|nr:hypothetical protein [Methylobacterium sp. PvR107]MBP1183557.1 hypothetical protein [Methylobacterium sp. PvR107]
MARSRPGSPARSAISLAVDGSGVSAARTRGRMSWRGRAPRGEGAVGIAAELRHRLNHPSSRRDEALRVRVHRHVGGDPFDDRKRGSFVQAEPASEAVQPPHHGIAVRACVASGSSRIPKPSEREALTCPVRQTVAQVHEVVGVCNVEASLRHAFDPGGLTRAHSVDRPALVIRAHVVSLGVAVRGIGHPSGQLQLGRGRLHQAEPHAQRHQITVGQRLTVDKPSIELYAPRLDRVAAQPERFKGLKNRIAAFAHKARLQRAGEGRL